MKTYKPTYGIYIAMIIGFIAIRICPVSLGSAVLNEAVNDLAVGALASTIVAFLIDISSCRHQNKQLIESKYECFRMFYLGWLAYIQLGAIACSICLTDDDYSQQKHTWIEWYELFKAKVSELKEADASRCMNFYANQWTMNYELISMELNKILDSGYLLRISSHISDEEFYRLSELSSVYSGTQNLIACGSKGDTFEYYDTFNNLLAAWINDDKEISRANKISFAPYELYNPISLAGVFQHSIK